MKSLKNKFIKIFNSYKKFFSGSILIACHDDVLFNTANGFANQDFSVINKIDTKFDTASVTKIFTAVAILQLIEQGKLSFNDKITELLDLKQTKIPSDVTIEQLLTHTSGIADDADEEAGEDYAVLFIDKPNYSVRNCRDFLPQFVNKEPVFKAGTNIRYNNCAFVLLGLAIEKITGTGYREYVSANIFKRCGMGHSCFQAKDDICPDTAEGYYAVADENGNFIKWKKNIYSFPPIGTPDGGAYTTVMDLNRFWTAIQNNSLLTPEYSAMLMQPQCKFIRPCELGNIRFGYAFEFIEVNNKVFCIYKEGVNNGVAAMFSYYPQTSINVNILSNHDGVLWELNRELSEVIFNAKYNA